MSGGKSEGLKVFVRVRPPIYKEVKKDTAIHVSGAQGITLNADSKEVRCSYDYVFNEISEQEQIFEKMEPLLVDVLSGINACIFAYGQTSAGKSYTMICPNGGQDVLSCPKEDWGIIPRASEFLLGYLDEKAVEGLLTYEVKASFLQIYNENLYDLLRDSGPVIDARTAHKDDKDELRIRELPVKFKNRHNARGDSEQLEVFVSGLSEYRVQTSEDILRIIAVGTSNRMTRSTDFNASSSRSHAILQLTFEIESQLPSGQTVVSRSKLNLVDLAGSEKIPYTEGMNNSKHIKELTSINKSLSSLGNVIAALSSGSRTHIPYRDSKLTRILQDSLSGNTRTVLIACVAPTVLHTSESLSTLQFADRAKSVMLTVKANQLVDDKFQLAKANNEIARLKTLLSRALKQLESKKSLSGTSSFGDSDGGSGNSSEELEQLRLANEELRKDNKSLRAMLKSNKSKDGNNTDSSVLSPSGLPSLKKSMRRQNTSDTFDNNNTPNNKTGKTTGKKKKTAAAVGAADGNVGGHHHRSKTVPPNQHIDSPLYGGQYASGNKQQSYDEGDGNEDYRLHSLSSVATKKKSNEQSKIKDATTAGGKTHNTSSLYKAINDRQIEELNAMLANANRKVNQDLEGDGRGLDNILGMHSTTGRGGGSGVGPTSDSSSSSSDSYTPMRSKEQPSSQGLPPLGSQSTPALSTHAQQYYQSSLNYSSDAYQQSPAASARAQQEAATARAAEEHYALQVQQQQLQAQQHQQQQKWLHHVQQQQQPQAQGGGLSPAAPLWNGLDSERSYPYTGQQPLGTDRSVPGSRSGRNISTPGNRIVMKLKQQGSEQQQQHGGLVSPAKPIVRNAGGKASSNSNSNNGAGAAFMAMAAMQQASPAGGLLTTSGKPATANGNAANLSYTKDDVGVPLQLFSFRQNTWDRIDVLDFEPNKRLHKVRHPDGAVQWLDLMKKPTRAMVED